MKASPKILPRLRQFLFREKLQTREDDDSFFYVGESPLPLRDRTSAGFRNLIEQSLWAWREDPLARRIVCLTTQFSVGRGFRVTADDPAADEILREFWENPLNRMDGRLLEWSDELCRTGNLFIMISSDPSGMSYARAIPAGQIEEIISQENDIEQPVCFRTRDMNAPGQTGIPEVRTIPAADLLNPTLEARMLHFTVNRPVGGQWGEPDLAPLLGWLDNYRQWLEDRVRLNHARSTFIYTVKSRAYGEKMRMERQAQLNMRPPSPGTILVTGDDEEWSTLHPNLDSSDANEDGYAIKKMIAAGAGIPVSFLAEPSGNSRAENGGMEDAACRNFRQRQQTLMWITETVLRHVLSRAGLVRHGLDVNGEIHVYGDDIAAPGMTEGGIIRGLSERVWQR